MGEVRKILNNPEIFYAKWQYLDGCSRRGVERRWGMAVEVVISAILTFRPIFTLIV